MPAGKKREDLRHKLRDIYNKELFVGKKKRDDAIDVVANTKITVKEVYTNESLMSLLFRMAKMRKINSVKGKQGK